MAVLRDIQADPERALKLGPHQGEDFVDLLIRIIPGAEGALRKSLTLCLMSYQDERTANFLAEAFAQGRDAITVLHLARRLRLDRGIDFFRPFLWDARTAQAVAAAEVCLSEPELSGAERLRIALLLEPRVALPGFDDPSWLAELHGSHRAQARQLAEQQGAGCLVLWDHWDQLEEPAQLWLLRLSERLDPVLTRQRLEELLSRGQLELHLLETGRRLGLLPPGQALDSTDTEVRALAVSAGLADDRLETYLTPDRSPAEAAAAASRCGSTRLLELLADPRWLVRAQAVRSLGELQPRPLAEVRQKMYSTLVEERAAAAELLLQWQDDEWLASFLEAESAGC